MSKMLLHPDDDLIEVQAMYRQLQSENIKMAALVKKAHKLSSSDSTRNIQVRVQMGYALLVAITLLYNAVLHNFDSTSKLQLDKESTVFVDEAILLAKQAAKYRPLGSSSMPLCLVVAWAVSDCDAIRCSEVESILEDYQVDFDGGWWLESAQMLRTQLRNPLAGSMVPKPHGVLGFSGIQMGLFDILLAEESAVSEQKQEIQMKCRNPIDLDRMLIFTWKARQLWLWAVPGDWVELETG
jgi:hypothetical protein